MNARKMRSIMSSVAGFVAAAGLVLMTPDVAMAKGGRGGGHGGGGHRSSGYHKGGGHAYRSGGHYRSYRGSSCSSRSSFSFSLGVGYSGGFYGGSYYRPSCSSYRVGGWGYGYSGCGPVYVTRPVYANGCAPFPYYYNAYPTAQVTYVYVDPPSTVRTTTSDSAYHAWQGALGAAPRYETVPRVIVSETDDEPAPAPADYREVSPSANAPNDEASAPGPPVEIVDPWEMVGRGDYASARDAFAALSEARLDEARPRIGYAIASAALGDEAASAAAFRMALIVEPESFRLPTGSDEIMPVLERVCHTLGNLKDKDATSNNRWMVMSACEYLRGEYPKARKAIKLAREYGETSLGAKNLWRLLGLSNKPLEKVRISDER